MIKTIATFFLCALLGFSINSTYKLMLTGMHPLILKVLYSLNVIQFCLICYLIYSKKNQYLKGLEIAILIISIGISAYFTSTWVKNEIKNAENSYIKTYSQKEFTPTSYFSLEEYGENHHDINYTPDLKKSDSTSFEIQNWGKSDVLMMLKRLKEFEKKHKLKSSTNNYSLEKFLKSKYYKVETTITYYKKERSFKTYILFWDNGHTIVSYGLEPLN